MNTNKGKFSEQDKIFLEDNYKIMTRAELAAALNRDDASIRHKLEALGLTSKMSTKGIRKYISTGVKRVRNESDDHGRLRLLKFINSQYTDKDYGQVSKAFIDLGRYEILNNYRRYSA